MADQIIIAPTRTDRPAFRFSTRLDGTFFLFRFVYNSRAQLWHFDLDTAEGTPIVHGLRLTTGIDLLAPFVTAGRPPGQLFVVDESGQGREPGRFAWVGDHRLIYRPAADVAALAGTDDEVP